MTLFFEFTVVCVGVALFSVFKVLEGVRMAVEDLIGKIARLSVVIDNLRSDIQTIKDSLPAEGGATPEQVAEVNVLLDALLAKAAVLDEENPGPPV